MKEFKTASLALLTLAATYAIAFVVLGWLASYNSTINRFYSSTFYSLRAFKESKYLNRLDQHQGVLKFSVSGEPLVLRDRHSGVGFEVPDRLRGAIAAIPDGTEVIVYIGRRLGSESVGVYHNELRRIERK